MRQLWNELRQLGVEEDRLPSARALEDWQQEGLIGTERMWLGRGRGSESRYSARTAKKVVQLIGILEAKRSFDWARMVLFYRGFDVDHQKLMGSYLQTLDRLAQESAKRGASTVLEEAEVDARRHSRAGQRRLLSQTFDKQAAAILASTIRLGLGKLLEHDETPFSLEDSAEIAAAQGVSPEIWNELTLDEKEDFEDKLSLTWLRAAIAQLEQHELTTGRDQLRERFSTIGIAPDDLEADFASVLPIFLIFSPQVPPPDLENK